MSARLECGYSWVPRVPGDDLVCGALGQVRAAGTWSRVGDWSLGGQWTGSQGHPSLPSGCPAPPPPCHPAHKSHLGAGTHSKALPNICIATKYRCVIMIVIMLL